MMKLEKVYIVEIFSCKFEKYPIKMVGEIKHLFHIFVFLDHYIIKFLDQLLTQEAVGEIDTMGFLAQVHAPTVTMPRIKAITTGSIPGFVDILLNFGSKELGKCIY